MYKTGGRYSGKRITAFTSFGFACIITLYSIYKGILTETIAFVIGEFLSAAMIMLGVASWQRIHLNNFSSSQLNEQTSDFGNVCTCGKLQNNQIN
jgi:hypothetical protein